MADPRSDAEPRVAENGRWPRWAEVGLTFLLLGLSSFGGPVAHLGIFERELVQKRKWLSLEEYGDLVSLCQFLPGPASSQLALVLGLRRGGPWAGALASLGFTLPSAVAMLLCARGATGVPPGVKSGLEVTAVAVLAQAVWSLGRRLCPDWRTRCIAALSGLVVLAWHSPLAHLLALLLGGAASVWALGAHAFAASAQRALPAPRWPRRGLALLLVAALLLLVLPASADLTGSRAVELASRFYRAGALVFGGGHVVLPLLEAEVVGPGWLTAEQFFPGYGAAQLLPGPLFAFGAYLGALLGPDAPIRTGLLCMVALFLPGWLVVLGALPSWLYLRSQPSARAVLVGCNAAVVGILLVSLGGALALHGERGILAGMMAVLGAVSLQRFGVPVWLVALSLIAIETALQGLSSTGL